MNTRKHLSIAIALAAFAVNYLPLEKLVAQEALEEAVLSSGEDRTSRAIEMTVNAGTDEEKQRSSHRGITEAVGVRLDQSSEITLTTGNRARQSVIIGSLDGGEIIAPPELRVSDDGTVRFNFQPGITPGLYRVMVTIGGEEYQLQFYGFGSPNAPQ